LQTHQDVFCLFDPSVHGFFLLKLFAFMKLTAKKGTAKPRKGDTTPTKEALKKKKDQRQRLERCSSLISYAKILEASSFVKEHF
jgi:hypothetical protein